MAVRYIGSQSVIYSTTPPAGVALGQLWMNTSTTPAILNEAISLTPLTYQAVSGGGGGTVTSVALSSTDLAVSGSPLTGSGGTITANLATQGGVAAGAFTNANVTVNSKGIITAIANGAAGQLPNTPVAASYATPLVVAAAYYAVYRCVLTGDVTIGLPTGGADGNSVTFWLTASGAARNVSLNAAIVIPSSSTFTSPQAIASGAKARLMIQYDATRGKWEIVSFINGY